MEVPFLHRQFNEGESMLVRWENHKNIEAAKHLYRKTNWHFQNHFWEFRELWFFIKNEGLWHYLLYSCDQSASQVQELQSKTLASHEEKSLPYYKRRNILVMILACCNTSSGNLKLKIAFVGNPENLMPSKI